MYRKLRLRIFLFSVTALIVLFLGTVFVVYRTSYREMLLSDREMLSRYADAYWTNGDPADSGNLPPSGPPPEGLTVLPPEMTQQDSGRLVSGQFWSVETDGRGNAADVHNPDPGKISDADLTAMTAEILKENRGNDGVKGTWVYHIEGREGRTLAVFLDISLVSSGTWTLIVNSLRYGSLMILILIAAAWFASGALVRPLERNEAAQRRFISDAGHELKTPIAVIAANAELLERKIGPDRWLDNIRAENERSAALVGSMLDLTRSAEKSEPPERLDLGALTESTVLPFEGPAFEKGHALFVSAAPGIFVMGRKQQLCSLLSILTDNAVQYSSGGSDITLTLSAEGRYAVLRVKNICPPMTAEDCRRLFDRFYRADPSRAGEGHYGMGLSIAKKIAEDHGGSISAAWRDGEITFRCMLPLKKS